MTNRIRQPCNPREKRIKTHADARTLPLKVKSGKIQIRKSYPNQFVSSFFFFLYQANNFQFQTSKTWKTKNVLNLIFLSPFWHSMLTYFFSFFFFYVELLQKNSYDPSAHQSNRSTNFWYADKTFVSSWLIFHFSLDSRYRIWTFLREKTFRLMCIFFSNAKKSVKSAWEMFVKSE